MSDRPSLRELHDAVPFRRRHIGPDEPQRREMLDRIGYPSLDALMAAAVPASIAGPKAGSSAAMVSDSGMPAGSSRSRRTPCSRG